MEHHIKGYYFNQLAISGSGMRDKVLSQIKTFQNAGFDVKLVDSPIEEDGIIRGTYLIRQFVCRLPFTFFHSRHTYREEYQDADFYYIRFMAGDWYFTRFLRKLKKNNPKAKIIMELPDYPTTYYMTTSKLFTILYLPIILKDIAARIFYPKYIDRIAIPDYHEKLYGIPTIIFNNGIDLEKISVRHPSAENKLKMIAVASMRNFHGYDRLIEGIHQYYLHGGVREMELHLVGGSDGIGCHLDKYNDLCQKYNLEHIVIIHGEKRGSELDEVYDLCNMAVASLGFYRINRSVTSSLKIREYLAKGLPVITGCDTDIFQIQKFPFCIQVENNDSPVNMEDVLSFYDSVYDNPDRFHEINMEIRDYADKYCDSDYAFRKVIDYIKEK